MKESLLPQEPGVKVNRVVGKKGSQLHNLENRIGLEP